MSKRCLGWIGAVLLTGLLPCGAGEIHEAIEEGNVDQVTRLIRDHPDLLLEQNDNPTQDYPLHTAASEGQLEIARLLLDAGAEIDALDRDASTPLHDAALRGHPEVVALLLERGADVHRRDFNGAYSLSFAVSGGDTTVIRQIIAAGADFYHRSRAGFALLHFAAMRGLEDLVDQILTSGEYVDVRTMYGDTPLKWATVRNHMGVMRTLLAHGADPNSRGTEGSTALMRAAARGNLDAGRLLLAWGADVNQADNWGRTALFETCWDGQTEFARMLLAQGAQFDVADSNGHRPLMFALRMGHGELVAALLEAGAEPNFTEVDYGFTPLHMAAIKGYEDVAADLIAHGAEMDTRDLHGDTPLALAGRYGHSALARMLIDRGAAGSMATHPMGLSSFARLPEQEAVVWFLGHSGWGIKTKDHFFILDYAKRGRLADQASLCNGHVVPAELSGEDVMVLVSHVHGDHYDPSIWDWREQLENVTYVMGFEPEVAEGEPSLPAYEFIGARQTRTIDGVKITTIESNDTGVGFVLEVDGLTIFHAGDHANRERDLSGVYPAEIEWLQEHDLRPDIAFLPIAGCGFGDQVAVKIGAHYALEKLRPRVFFPMHAGDYGKRYHEFIDECRADFPHVQMDAAQAPGDRFHYSHGNLTAQDTRK